MLALRWLDIPILAGSRPCFFLCWFLCCVCVCVVGYDILKSSFSLPSSLKMVNTKLTEDGVNKKQKDREREEVREREREKERDRQRQA